VGEQMRSAEWGICLVQRASVLECASPLALSITPSHTKSGEDWRTPRPAVHSCLKLEIAAGINQRR